VVLAGADLSPAGLVQAQGKAPGVVGPNRFRLPPRATVPTDEFQQVADDVVTVSSQAKPAPLADRVAFLEAETNLELDDPALRAWSEASAGAGAAAERAERLRLAARSHINNKDMGVAEGTALETFRSRQGDCTEHATLLCAALRIAGIPARIEIGLVYAPSFGGWVGHSWVSAYADDRWIHLDAAYPGIERCRYISLGRASGNAGGGAGAALTKVMVGLFGQPIKTLP
jgi:transglutaminase-like putative cysteine protease